MSQAKSDTTPLYDVMHEYQASLKEYMGAAMLLHASVSAALRLASAGADPAKLLESIREHDERFEKAAHGIVKEAK